MPRPLFCELHPICYELSVWKGRVVRWLADWFLGARFAQRKSADKLPVVIERHKSLILALVASKISDVLIRPGETFSFWRLVGLTAARRGYKTGLMIRHGKPDKGIGGGLCQMTNLIHWLVLHSPLEIVEHHHHDAWDLFPDFGRQVPFGLGTSISHNYLDYRFTNTTDQTFQLLLWCDDTYLNGELRAARPLTEKYHIRCADEHFTQENGVWYRHNKIYRTRIVKETGKSAIPSEIIKVSHARVMYDEAFIPFDKKDLSTNESQTNSIEGTWT